MTNTRELRVATLIVKENNQAGMRTSAQVAAWLEKQGVAHRVVLHPSEPVGERVLPETDLAIIFAGDGTMVSVARQLVGRDIPVAGINFGRVGFLAELSESTWQQAFFAALQSGFTVQKRMALQYTLYRGEQCLCRGEVVNDAVVTRGKVARLVSLQLQVNNSPFVSLRSDGLIFSTPTGASGYAGSAGGPLVLPTLDAYVVAAICPYLSSFPPMILSHDTLFSVKIEETAPDLYLTLDGQEVHPLSEGDCLELSGVPGRIVLADFGLNSYFSRLVQAGFVHETKRLY